MAYIREYSPGVNRSSVLFWMPGEFKLDTPLRIRLEANIKYAVSAFRIRVHAVPPKNTGLYKLEISKLQDLAKNFGGMASKAEEKMHKSKNCKLDIET